MNVLSLFDGISACQLALNKAGYEVGDYHASEIDKYAIQCTQSNYPDTNQLGDVLNWEQWEIDWSGIDLVTSGFPCQAWSLSGKQQGDKDPRGMLFWTMLDIISYAQQHNPEVNFFIENVKMKKEFEEYITKHTSEALGTTYKTMINSSIVCPQNRTRYYWSSKPLSLPKEVESKLADILEDDPEDKYYYSEEQVAKLVPSNTNQDKAIKLLAHRANYRRNYQIFDPQGKTETIDTAQGGGRKIGTLVDNRYRQLTPMEYERLQTFPDNYTKGLSDSQRYKALGNSWTVDVVSHCFKDMFNNLLH
ncbi:DNA (cytosine-5-)-methyltransferase [Vibrio breoganii]